MRLEFVASAPIACATLTASPVSPAAPVVTASTACGADTLGGSTLLFLDGCCDRSRTPVDVPSP